MKKNLQVDGDVTGKYLTGTWLRTIATTDLGKTPPKVAVLDNSGWIYYRTLQGLRADLGINDYVVEQGTSGIWTYRKWSSGVAECWGSYTTTGGSSTEGSLYWKGTSTAYPSGLFIGTPIAEATLQGKWIGGILSSDSHSKDSFTGYVWTAEDGSSHEFIIHIRATGRWK